MPSFKKVFLKLCFAAALLTLGAYANSKDVALEKSTIIQSTLIWQSNMSTAFALAEKEQKNVMVMVEDQRCRWCVRMKKGALSDPKVQQNLQHYILLKIDRGDNASMESLPGLRGPIPSFHFFTAEKIAIEKIAGYYETEDFLEYINEIAEDMLQL